MPRRKDRWKKANKAYSLSEIGSPLPPSAIQNTIRADLPICCEVYGHFSESMLAWIDQQPLPSFEDRNPELYRRMFLDLPPSKRNQEQVKNLRNERSEIVAARRSRFNKNRDQLMLAMLHAGRAYICAHASCGDMRNLHVDHIVPLSKGGGDEMSNLQFLCPKHNSEKGSKYPDS